MYILYTYNILKLLSAGSLHVRGCEIVRKPAGRRGQFKLFLSKTEEQIQHSEPYSYNHNVSSRH